MKRLLFTLLCLLSLLTQAHASSIWEEDSQWDVYYTVIPVGIEDSIVLKVSYRLLPADGNYMALEKTTTFMEEGESIQIQGYIRNDGDSLIYVRPVLEDGSIGDECLLYDFCEPYEYGGTVRYGVIGGEVKEEFIDWQEDTLDYYMMNNGDMHCLPAWKGIIYQYGYIEGPMELFLLQATPGKKQDPKPTNISHVIFSTKGGHKVTYMNWWEEDNDIIISYDEMLTNGTTWECLAIDNEQPDLKNTYNIQVKGDTLVGNRHCKQIYSPEYGIQRTLFEEGRKVYVLDADGHPEVLLDYNLQVGDHWIDDVATVVSVENQENQGYDYRTITIDMGFDCASYFAGDTAPWAYNLIEGIGPSKDQYLKQRFIHKENTFSYLLRCWKDGTLVYQVPQGSEYEYVSFVREGIKWVYAYNNPFLDYVLDMPIGLQYYSYEMKGNVQIGDKTYKPVVLTHYLDKDGQSKEVEDYTPICLREENKVVYAIHPDGILHPQCPVGYGWYISDPYGDLPLYTTNEEFVLYDFNDPMRLYSSEDFWGEVEYCGSGTMTIGGEERKYHHYQSLYGEDDLIIEGIGYDGMAGFPLFYFETFITGLQVGYGLSHVIENGQVVYTGRWYDPGVSVGIDEVVIDKTGNLIDENYYNLMGQPMGKQLPTTAGIYIHHGKKIVIR